MSLMGDYISERLIAFTLVVVLFSPGQLLGAQVRCPDTKSLPQLTIDVLDEPTLPVVDRWQVLLDGVALSDMQVAQLARNDVLIEALNNPLKHRGSWVFWSLAAATLGTGVSATGFVLFGQNDLSRAWTLSMALGGLVIGIGSLLLSTEAIVSSLEAHLAPAPTHRVSREEMRDLIVQINHRFYREACFGLQGAGKYTLEPPSLLELPNP